MGREGLRRLRLFSSSKWDGTLALSLLLKLPPGKIGALIHSMKFLSPEVAFYLYKSTMQSRIEYFCYVCAGIPSCHMAMLKKPQKWIYRTTSPSLAVSIEPLAQCRNVATFSIAIVLVDLYLKWLKWFHFLILITGPPVTIIGCTIFLSPFLKSV